MKRRINDVVLKKIREKNVRIRPIYYYWARSGFWFFLAFLLFLILSLLVSVVLRYLASDLVADFMGILLLIALTAVLPALVFVNAKLYRRGRIVCRHEEWVLYLALIFGSLFFGSLLFYLEFDQEIFRFLRELGILKLLLCFF